MSLFCRVRSGLTSQLAPTPESVLEPTVRDTGLLINCCTFLQLLSAPKLIFFPRSDRVCVSRTRNTCSRAEHIPREQSYHRAGLGTPCPRSFLQLRALGSYLNTKPKGLVSRWQIFQIKRATEVQHLDPTDLELFQQAPKKLESRERPAASLLQLPIAKPACLMLFFIITIIAKMQMN